LIINLLIIVLIIILIIIYPTDHLFT